MKRLEKLYNFHIKRSKTEKGQILFYIDLYIRNVTRFKENWEIFKHNDEQRHIFICGELDKLAELKMTAGLCNFFTYLDMFNCNELVKDITSGMEYKEGAYLDKTIMMSGLHRKIHKENYDSTTIENIMTTAFSRRLEALENYKKQIIFKLGYRG